MAASGGRRKPYSDDPAIPVLLDVTLPNGYAYRPEIVSSSDERALVGLFATLPFKPFEFHGYLGNRRIVSYGHRYDYSLQALQVADPMPAWLVPLQRTAEDLLKLRPDSLAQALVTEYAPGAGIGWHRDKPMFEHVVSISFGGPCMLRLRRRIEGKWLRAKQIIMPRSAYILSGEARDIWEHSIPPADQLRYSVTFRDFRRNAAPERP